MRALVVGAGISGLAVAIGLVRSGWEVEVHERAGGPSTEGTGLGIWPSGVRALEGLGLREELLRRGRRQRSGVIRRPDGRRIAVIHADAVERRRGEPVTVIPRPDLLALLAAELPSDVVRYGSTIGRGDVGGTDHDLVVGADGIASQVRASRFPDTSALRYAGLTAWRGVAPLELEAGGETWGRGEKFGFTPQAPGWTNWYAACRVPEGYVPPSGDLDELLRRFGRWHDPIPRVLAGVAPDTILRHPLHYLAPPLRSYVEGRVALLGDAAHAMTPDLGQGACQALVDGVTLARCLGGGHDLAQGLREYDRLRRRPTQRIAAAATLVGRLSVASRLTGLRDLALRAAAG